MTVKRLALLQLTVAVIAAAFVVGQAQAHGIIQRADPAAGSAVGSAPAQARIWFNEPFDPRFSNIVVYAAEGGQAVSGGAFMTDDGALAVSLNRNLPDGLYRVEWQVFTPGDGHTTAGSYSFGVGVPSPSAQTVEPEGSWLADAIRFCLLAGQSLFVGVALFRWLIPLEDEARFSRSLVWPAWVTRWALLVGLFGGLYLQSQTYGLLNALANRWGVVWLARALLVAVAIWHLPRWWQKSLGGVALGVTLLFAGSLVSHSAAKTGALGALIDWGHTFTAGVWVGGLLCTAIALRHGERKFLSLFALVATAAVGGLAATGAMLASEQVGSWRALLLTPYGRALMAKLLLAVTAMTLGAVNAFRLGERRVWLEGALAMLVVLLAAVTTNLPPAYSVPTDNAPTRLEIDKRAGEIIAGVAVWPARLGTNTLEARLHDLAGEPLSNATVVAHFQPLQGGAVVSYLPMLEVGDGVYSATGSNLTAVGAWQVLLTVNDRHYLNFEIKIGEDGAVRAADVAPDSGAQVVGWLKHNATFAALILLLLALSGWSWLAWRSLPRSREQLALWLIPGMIAAGVLWLWLKLIF